MGVTGGRGSSSAGARKSRSGRRRGGGIFRECLRHRGRDIVKGCLVRTWGQGGSKELR